jgi:hypothetical protein
MSGTPNPSDLILAPYAPLLGIGGGAGAVKALRGRAMTPPAPTTGSNHPARPATATTTGTAAPTGKARILPFLIGAALALALADTRARPIVVAILVGAIIFQLTRATGTANQ